MDDRATSIPNAASEQGAFIYALSDPKLRTMPRYIGKTKNRLRVRLNQHIAGTKRYSGHLSSWIKSLLRLGRRPIIWPLELCHEENWQERERYWIWFFNPLKMLTNLKPGGNGSHQVPALAEETKRKIRNAHLGRKLTPEQIEKRKKIISGIPRSERQKRQFFEMLKNRNPHRKYSEAGRLKLRSRKVSEKSLQCLKFGIFATSRAVRCIETGKVFQSLAEAGRYVGVDGSKIGRAIRSGGTSMKLKWQFIDNNRKTNVCCT